MNGRYDLGAFEHNSRPSMIVHYLNFNRVAFNPAEADPPLVVDPNTVLTSPIAGQGLQAISGNHSQIGNGCRRLNVIELSLGHYGDTLKLQIGRAHALPICSPARSPARASRRFPGITLRSETAVAA